MSLPGVDLIRDRRPFKRKPHFGYLGTASQDSLQFAHACRWKAA